jgi:hypothetical protein
MFAFDLLLGKQKLARPIFFYFVKNVVFRKILESNLDIYISNFIPSEKGQEHMFVALNDTHFVNKHKIFINSFSLGNRNYEIKSSHPLHILW